MYGFKIPNSVKSQYPQRMVFFDTESLVAGGIEINKEEINILLNTKKIKELKEKLSKLKKVEKTNKELQKEIEKIKNDIKKCEKIKKDKVIKEHDIYLLCSCFVILKSGNYETNYKDYTENIREDFWKNVHEFTEKGKITYVFAHNASYDTLVSGAVEELVKYGYIVDSFSESNPFFIFFENRENKDKKIQILTTTNYFKTSIEELGKKLNLPKLEYDYNKVEMENAIIYCRRDVEVMMYTMFNYFDFLKKENLGSFGITIAGQAFTAFRHRFMKTDIYLHRKKDSVILERLSYSGGRTECFKIGKFNQKLYYYDKNSMYPYNMKFNKFPQKLISYRKNIKKSHLLDFLNDDFLITAKCFISTNERVFPIKREKLIFPVGKFWCYLSTPEIKYALKNDMIQFVEFCNIYESADIFSNYVDYFYNKRLEAKEKKDEVFTYFYKLYLNSLYGKFGQKNIHWEKIEDVDDVTEIRTIKEFDVETKKQVNFKIFGGGKFRELEEILGECESKYAFCAIASHVTAYARMDLWECMKIAGVENIYYMDTDSLIVNEIGKKRLENAKLIDSKKLGMLKLEAELLELEIRGCKDYKYKYIDENGKLLEVEKIKGVNLKNSVKVDDNNYVTTIWRSMAKNIKSGNLAKYSNELMLKTLERKYNKGIVEGMEVKPIFINEWENKMEANVKYFNL